LADNVIGRLAESFAYLATVSDSEALRQNLLGIEVRLRELSVVPPQLGCLYLQIVAAVESGEETAGVQASEQLLEILSGPWELAIARYGRDELGRFYENFSDILFDSSYGNQTISEPTEPTWLESKDHFERALELIRVFDPTVYQELETFWSRITIGVANPDSDKAKFGGVTSLILWGGTFANGAYYDSEIKAAECLVHEITHALLFAIGCDEPLVLNPPEELFGSPLRKDLRPMDGTFHATLVCARVAEFYSILRGSGADIEVDDETLIQCRKANAEKFQQGYATVEEFGKISPLGKDLLEQARARLQVLENEG
jgi:HEXXH motif-containing protein